MGLIPLAWLTSLWSGGERVSRTWWLLAFGFSASWIADWLSHTFGAFPVGPFYLFLQAALIVWALAPPATALRFVIVLGATCLFAAINLDTSKPDVLVHTVAWGGILVLCWTRALAYRLRWVLGIAFGLGGLAWLGYVLNPGWAAWSTYQAVRAVSLGLFCWASWHPSPPLRVA